MKLSMSKTREQFPLNRKKILKKTVPSLYGSVILFFGSLILMPLWAAKLYWAAEYRVIIIFVIFITSILNTLFMYIFQKFYFQLYFYELGDDFVVIRKRVLTPREITVPYERIQDVYMDQDLLDRIFGLYDVHLASAAFSSEVEAHIDGLEKQAAEGIKDQILSKVKQKIQPAVQEKQ